MSILFVEEPLVVNTALARIIGLNEAIVLQQIDYWVKINKKKKQNFRDGQYWTYNSIPKWHEETFPFWSFDTVKRTFAKLEKQNLILSGNYNSMKSDRTKWYTVNYEVVDKLGQERESEQNAPMHNDAEFQPQEPENPHGYASGQNAPMNRAKCTDAKVQNAPTITKDFTETYTEIKQDDDDICVPQFSESYYPEDYLQELEEREKRIEEAKAKEEPRTALNDMFKAWDEHMKMPIKQHHAARLVEFLQEKNMEEIAIVEAIERAKDADFPAKVLFIILEKWHREGGRTLAQCLQTPSEVKYREQQEAKLLREQMQELKQASGTNYTGGNRKPDVHTQISHGGFESLDFLNPTKSRVDVTGGYHS